MCICCGVIFAYTNLITVIVGICSLPVSGRLHINSQFPAKVIYHIRVKGRPRFGIPAPDLSESKARFTAV